MLDAFDDLLALTRALPQTDDLICKLESEGSLEVRAVAGSMKSILLTHLFEKRPNSILWVFASQDLAENAKIDLEHLLPVKASSIFPVPRKSEWGHDDVVVVSRQAEALVSLSNSEKQILLATNDALYTKVKSRKLLVEQAVHLEVGKEYSYDALLAKLQANGFERDAMVGKPGDLAVRGGIVDVFPYTAAYPVRVEFWGDKIESIREFDVNSQRSNLNVKKISVFPKPSQDEDDSGGSVSLIDYLAPSTLVVFDDAPAIQGNVVGHTKASSDDLDQQGGEADDERWLALLERLGKNKKLFFSPFKSRFSQNRLSFASRHPYGFNGDIKLLAKSLKDAAEKNETSFFLCETAGHAERMRELFDDYDVSPEEVKVVGLSLGSGFSLPDASLNVYTDHEFYGRLRRRRAQRKFKEGLTLKELQALSIDDFIVHVDHGVGRFVGLEKIEVRERTRECLLLEYRDGDKLYVPLDKMDRVQKYTSKEGHVPKIHKLGSPEWQKTKKKTRKRARDIAQELIKLYSMRKAQVGMSFSPDTTWQRELEASFQYEDTPDQHKAVQDVKEDMEKSEPMDRLVCGDVGFGKTEVAVRAAFKTVQDGRQVAILVPTTILAEQHHITFNERLKRFPVRVEVLSRFRSRKEQTEIVKGIRDGGVDIVVGTHRLLSKDIEFKRLGLLIIDEEHRFGVKHKEKLKELRVNVDVLALSATPIPRTLHMSLMGVRNMSLINTAPRDRQPVHTETMEFNAKVIREAVLYELQRGGQIFFVHNRVNTIKSVANKIAKIIPEADIVIGHGQMKEHELEKVMMDFMQNRYQILVSTMIIESGLDIPNVNTIFVNRADKFGLAQLYQLRGRVGRSHRKAFCYLIVPPLQALTQDAVRRLETIEEFTDLGSGIQVALRDLEIRGAGDLLGAEQTGFIQAVGLEMFLKILDEEVKEIQRDQSSKIQENALFAEDCKVDIDADAYLPQKYADLAMDRIDIYRRLAHVREYEQIEALEEEVVDRFGRMPVEAKNLFYLTRFRFLGRKCGFRFISVKKNRTTVVRFSKELLAAPNKILQSWIGKIVASASQKVEFVQSDELYLTLSFPDEMVMFDMLEFLENSAQAIDAVT